MIDETAKRRLYREAIALLEQSLELLSGARAKHEQKLAENYKKAA